MVVELKVRGNIITFADSSNWVLSYWPPGLCETTTALCAFDCTPTFDTVIRALPTGASAAPRGDPTSLGCCPDTAWVQFGAIGSGYVSMNDADASASIYYTSPHPTMATCCYTLAGGRNSGVDLAAAAAACGWDSVSPLQITIPYGATYGATCTSNDPGIHIKNKFPQGLTLINCGWIVGAGGNGGNGCITTGCPGVGGSPGLEIDPNVNNISLCNVTGYGVIMGGGGGGGGGGGCRTGTRKSGYTYYQGGGGGGGSSFDPASGGSGYNSGGNSTCSSAPATYSTFGAGGLGYYGSAMCGGNGGCYGQAGSVGCTRTYSGGSGGGAGDAIYGCNNINITQTGTMCGSLTVKV